MATLAISRPRLASDRPFFLVMGLAILATVFAGFAPTYFLLPWLHGVTVRGEAGGASLTPLVHVHGALFSAWILLFVAQAGLVARRRIGPHRALGAAMVALAPALVVVATWLAIDSGRDGRTPPGWTNDEAFLLVPFISIALYAGFVAAGFAWRRSPDYHKRLMLLATIAMLPPALARLMRIFEPDFLPPGVAGGLVVLNLYLAALLAFDVLRLGRLHPATIWGVAIYLVTWPARLTLGDTGPWQAFARTLIG